MKTPFPAEIMGQTYESHYATFNRRSRVLYLSVMVFLTLSFLSLFWISTDITILARGIFRSAEDPVGLVSPVVAEVEWTSLRENMRVSKGDTLVRLDNNKIRLRRLHLDQKISDNKLYLKDIEHLLKEDFGLVSTSLFRSQGSEFLQKLREYDLNVEYLSKAYHKDKHLYSRQVIAAADLEASEFQFRKIREDREIYRHLRISEWQRRAAELQKEMEIYRAEILELGIELEKYAITAPCDGHITHFIGIRSGSNLTAGQVVAMVSPADLLIAETFLDPGDIGYLHPGMQVNYQVDAFNHNLWGLASGEVVEVSEITYLVDNQPRFRILASINEPWLSLENGYTGLLKKGMTTTVRFRLTRRTVAQLLADKADKWLNPRVLNN